MGGVAISEEEFNNVRDLLTAGFSQARVADMLKRSPTVISRMAKFSSYDAYKAPKVQAEPQQVEIPIDEPERPEALTTVLNNIAQELTAINQRLERIEEAHETKLPFLRRYH